MTSPSPASTELPKRSVSQLKQYERCPHSYKLARIDKVWQRPAAWLPQGTAFHEVAEEMERRRAAGNPMTLEEALEMFKEIYARDIGELCKTTPNFDWWSMSGPYGGEEDVERRYHIGLEQVEKFYYWFHNQVIWIAPDGTPAIETSFSIELDGIEVRGFIDAVVVGDDGKPRVRDYKTGTTPGDDFQLGVYGLALAMKYGIEQPQLGDYYMAGKKGKKATVTYPYDIGEWTKEKVSDKFRWLEDNIEAGNFDPDPEPDKCKFCDVSYYCEFAEG
ncbi:exonuclease [Mycobacterium phage Anthony]|uniref:Cas4 exonuclease n=1 Tax=Mycobacterium phage Anthony TaxID=2599857 RepID=A0A5J6THT9_9CAUD|nr:exonuclease [Mycobacterium phage Anthony]QFG10441.1 Cas4 exonuclease [Mycobacterium phage Anthony]